MNIRRGDIVWVEFRSGNGHVQRGRRPCAVVSSNTVNGHAATLNVIPGTTRLGRKYNPVHVLVTSNDMCGYMGKDTLFLTEQITTIDKEQILCKAGYVTGDILEKLKTAMLRQLGLLMEGENNV